MTTAEQFGYAVETQVDFDHECTCQPLQNGLGFARGLRMRDAHQRAASINRQRCCERHQAVVLYCPTPTRGECKCDYPGILCNVCESVAVGA